jgi:hypothetical protein
MHPRSCAFSRLVDLVFVVQAVLREKPLPPPVHRTGSIISYDLSTITVNKAQMATSWRNAPGSAATFERCNSSLRQGSAAPAMVVPR